MPKFSMFLLLLLSVVATACENRKAEAASASASAAIAASAASLAQPAATETATKVVRIVFVGKEHACDCTRKTLDAGWTALQKVLGTPAKIPVERLQLDTEQEKVEPYRLMRPMLALPGIYFIDGKGGLVEMLQGEITEAQVSKVLSL